MKKLKKIIKMILLSIVGIVLFLVITVALFVNLSPQFGKGPTKEQQEVYNKSGHFENGKFVNTHASPMDVNFGKVLKEMIKKDPTRKPSKTIAVEKIDSLNIVNTNDSITQLTWFGHSTFLLEMDGKKILIDPMFGDTPSPHPWLGVKRYSKELPIEVEQLPAIDAVILSHDHYDHLDYESIKKLKDKVAHYYAPLGVGNHLIEWGVDPKNVHEFNWWDATNIDNIELVCTPARHFSGRGLTDRASTLWASWVIKGKKSNIFFSGDSGYDDHFKEIGKKYGPFDIALMECGQYNQDWKYIHMMPEETAQAAVDVKSKVVLPIHWGAFTLAFHSWTDPIERVSIKAKELGIPVATPKIGEPIIIGNETYPNQNWWKDYQ